MHEIKSLTGAVLFRSETATDVRMALVEAVEAKANLSDANLSRADLSRANLSDAYLSRADLRDAYLDGKTVLPTGEPWSKYLAEVLPALIAAGGLPAEATVTEEHWNCHDWDNCPMAAAFGVKAQSDTPILLRPRVDQFVQLFDAGLIPLGVARKACGLA